MKIKKYTDLNRKTIDEFRESEKFPIVVILENIRSMHNVGSVFRTADAFLISGIRLCGYTPKPPHRDIHKTALGATDTVAWQYSEKTADAINVLKQEGYKVFAVEQVEKSISLRDFSFHRSEKIAVIFGNEVTGIEQEALNLCDGSIEIPQYGMKHSLNISVAAGIVLWELVHKNI